MRQKFAVVMLLVVLAGCLFAQTPRLINYQGKLTDADGVGLNGDFDITFKLYTVSTGGTPVFSEAHTGVTDAVTVTKGLFDVQLGSLTAGEIPLQFDVQYYLELEIGTETLAPREKLATSPYAFHSIISDTAFVLAGDHGASSGQILKWDGDSWEPVNDESGTDDQNLTEVLGEGNSAGTHDIDMNDNAILNIDWTTSDDGSGSFLDADLLDGEDGAYYLDDTDDQNLSYTVSTRALDIDDGTGVTLPLYSTSNTDAGLVPGSAGATTDFLRGDGTWATPSSGTDDQNLTEVLGEGNSAGTYDIDMNDNAILNIDWTTSDDGSGSFLDADLLDGEDGAYYLDNTDAQDLSYTPATNTVNISGGTGTALPTFTDTDDGLTPASGGGTTSYLRADGTWATPSSGTDDQNDTEVALTTLGDFTYIDGDPDNVHEGLDDLDDAIAANEATIDAHIAADGDLDDENELQNLFNRVTDGTNTYTVASQTDILTMTGAGGVDVTVNGTTGEVTIDASSAGDDWGSQDVVSDATLNGTGVTGDALGTVIGNTIETGEITDDEILEEDLDMTTHATAGEDNFVMTYDDASGGFTWVDPTTVGTDDQNISGSGFNGTTNILTIGIEDGTSETIDLSDLDNAGSDDQDLSFSGSASPYSLDITDGSSVTFAQGDGITLSRSLTELTIAAVLGNTIEGSEITDGTIMNTDINASAAIDWTKFATGTANRILMTNGSGVMTVVGAPSTNYYLKWNGTAYEWASMTGDMDNHIDGDGITGGTYNGSSEITWAVNTGNGIEISSDQVVVQIITSGGTHSGLEFDASGNLIVSTGEATTSSTNYKVFRNH